MIIILLYNYKLASILGLPRNVAMDDWKRYKRGMSFSTYDWKRYKRGMSFSTYVCWLAQSLRESRGDERDDGLLG